MRNFNFRKVGTFLVCLVLVFVILFSNSQVQAAQSGDYFYIVKGGYAQITRYIGTGGNVSIPSTLEGFSVNSIGSNAFINCTNVKSITIPQGVMSIGDSAFNNCTRLTSINVSENNFYYKSINGVLYNKAETILISCPAGLASISIPQSVTSIGFSAFYNCKNLLNIGIPEGVTSIGDYAFYRCTGLKNIIIPEGITNIGDYVFLGCMGLTDITIPQGVKGIGDWAFTGCTSLESINIPEGVISIGDFAFSNCASLTNIIVSSENLNYTSINGILFNKAGTLLLVCPAGLSDVSISKSVTRTDEYAFFYCTNLATIRFDSATTSIFNNPNTIPANTKIIGYNPSTAKTYASKYGRQFEEIDKSRILESISIITPATKLSYSVDETLSIEGLVVAGNYSNGSSEIETINVANIKGFNSKVAATDQVLTINISGKSTTYKVQIDATSANSDFVHSVISGKAKITGYTGRGGVVIIPSMLGGAPVTSIGNYAFQGNLGITNIKIPENVTSIGISAFTGCEGLTEIVIPEKVTSIGDWAFDGCYALVSIKFNSATTIIFDSALVLPSTTKIIGHNTSIAKAYAMKYNREFAAIDYTAQNVVSSISTDFLYTITAGKAKITGYIGLGGVVAIPEMLGGAPVTSIGNYAFQGNLGIKNITIPGSVTSIGNSSFSGCAGLTSIVIPHGVKSVGNWAFDGCSSLESARFNSATTVIYNSAYVFPATTKIIGFANSIAKFYAKKYNRTFEVIM